MICPECETEYRPGYIQCADCGVALVEELTATMAPLVLDRDPVLIGTLVEALEAAQIPYAIEAGTALILLDDPDAEVTEPDAWIARVWITAAREEEAKEILDEVRAEVRAAGSAAPAESTPQDPEDETE